MKKYIIIEMDYFVSARKYKETGGYVEAERRGAVRLKNK